MARMNCVERRAPNRVDPMVEVHDGHRGNLRSMAHLLMIFGNHQSIEPLS